MTARAVPTTPLWVLALRAAGDLDAPLPHRPADEHTSFGDLWRLGASGGATAVVACDYFAVHLN